MQWFIFNFHCMITSPKETVNDFCPFYFLKESLYETINPPNTYLYEHGLTFVMKKDAMCVAFHYFFFPSEQ